MTDITKQLEGFEKRLVLELRTLFGGGTPETDGWHFDLRYHNELTKAIKDGTHEVIAERTHKMNIVSTIGSIVMHTSCRNHKGLSPVSKPEVTKFHSECMLFPETDVFVMVCSRQKITGKHATGIVFEQFDDDKPWRHKVYINEFYNNDRAHTLDMLKSVLSYVSQMKAKTAVKEPVAEPVVEPAVEPVADNAKEPVAETVVEPVVKPKKRKAKTQN